MQNSTEQPPNEEFANCVTHAGGTVLAVVGAVVVFQQVAEIANAALRFACWLYAIALVALYAASTLSHLTHTPARRRFFRSLDQGMIFLFIAANFTPLAITYLHDQTGWVVLAVTWTIAIAGFSSKVFWGYRVESTAVTHYLALGWLPVVVIEPILKSLPTSGLLWCVAGGLCYTVGTVVMSFDTRVRYFHALWHFLVVAGSFCHFLVVVNYIIPSNS